MPNPNNAEHMEAEQLKHTLRELCQKHGADPENANVTFGDEKGQLSFSLVAPINNEGQVLIMEGTLTPIDASQESYPSEFQN